MAAVYLGAGLWRNYVSKENKESHKPTHFRRMNTASSSYLTETFGGKPHTLPRTWASTFIQPSQDRELVEVPMSLFDSQDLSSPHPSFSQGCTMIIIVVILFTYFTEVIYMVYLVVEHP